MKERILKDLTPQVRENCLVSDAKFWGYYTICGLLLRLREQYRFEQGLGPGDPTDMDDITRWIGEREARWEELSEKEFSRLTIDAQTFEPFDVEGINAALAPHDLLYGAGYGVYMKPVFFLADLDAKERMGDLDVYFAGREYVRDLSVHAAMLQERTVLARREGALTLIAEKYEEYLASRGGGALEAAFTAYGVSGDVIAHDLEHIARAELRSFVHHEHGEYLVSEASGGIWNEVIACSPQQRSCHFVRGLKDVLADTVLGGMLDHIIKEKKQGSLAFYIAMLTGYRKLLSAPMEEAFSLFTKSGKWDAVEHVRVIVFDACSKTAKRLLDTYRQKKDPEALEKILEKEINRLSPERT